MKENLDNIGAGAAMNVHTKERRLCTLLHRHIQARPLTLFKATACVLGIFDACAA